MADLTSRVASLRSSMSGSTSAVGSGVVGRAGSVGSGGGEFFVIHFWVVLVPGGSIYVLRVGLPTYHTFEQFREVVATSMLLLPSSPRFSRVGVLSTGEPSNLMMLSLPTVRRFAVSPLRLLQSVWDSFSTESTPRSTESIMLQTTSRFFELWRVINVASLGFDQALRNLLLRTYVLRAEALVAFSNDRTRPNSGLSPRARCMRMGYAHSPAQVICSARWMRRSVSSQVYATSSQIYVPSSLARADEISRVSQAFLNPPRRERRISSEPPPYHAQFFAIPRGEQERRVIYDERFALDRHHIDFALPPVEWLEEETTLSRMPWSISWMIAVSRSSRGIIDLAIPISPGHSELSRAELFSMEGKEEEEFESVD